MNFGCFGARAPVNFDSCLMSRISIVATTKKLNNMKIPTISSAMFASFFSEIAPPSMMPSPMVPIKVIATRKAVIAAVGLGPSGSFKL